LSGSGGKANPWADLVIAMLSVNSYSLEKTFSLFDSLAEQGLFVPTKLSALGQADIAKRLGAAGYSRGDTMTAIFAERLGSLGRLTADIPVEDCTRILLIGGREEVSSLLSRVKGIGPRVLANFFILRGESSISSPGARGKTNDFVEGAMKQ
jgi:hypothetical protein